MHWLWVGGYLASSVFTFRRVLYLEYKEFSDCTLDGLDWTMMIFLSTVAALCGPAVAPCLLGYSGIKSLNRKGVTIPHGLLMSVPAQERKELKEARKRRERIEREQYIARLERELGIGQ